MPEPGSNEYLISRARCNNCGKESADVVIPKGTTVHKYACPHCGCKETLWRVEEAQPGGAMVG